MQRWEKKIKATLYLLKPKQLAALRAADFPLLMRDAIWIDRYLELFAFTKEHGHARVTIHTGGPLGSWVSQQRVNRLAGKLIPARQWALERLNFVWDAPEALWKDRLTELTHFIQTHGHMHIPGNKTNRQLASWVKRWRKRKEKLSPKHLQDLKQLGVVWNPAQEAWQSGLEELKRFVKDHGHARVPARRSAYPLAGCLVQLARKLYRAGKLDAKRQSELESLGMIWNPMDDLWEERYQQLCEVHRRLGHIRMPDNSPENETLKHWVKRQKRRPHSLSDEQKERLIALDASFFVKRPPGWHCVYHPRRSRVSS